RGGPGGALRVAVPAGSGALFASRGRPWYRPGGPLPVFHVPSPSGALPLIHFLHPAPVEPLPPTPPDAARVRMRLVRDDAPRPTRAVEVSLEELAAWAETAMAHQLASVQVAVCEGRALLVGEAVPLFAGGARAWGDWGCGRSRPCPRVRGVRRWASVTAN